MRLRDENKELAIREKALGMIVEEGFDGLSMHKLAKAAGVSPATIYIYFRDRDDLIMQIFETENTRMTEITLDGFSPEMHFEEGLRIQWLNRARYCLENPERMHFMEQIRYSPFHERLQGSSKSTFIHAMRTWAQNAIARGELVPLPMEVYWSVAFAPLYQLVKFHMSRHGLPGSKKFTLDEPIMNQTLELVIKALTPQ